MEDAALEPLAPGELIVIGSEQLRVCIAPAAGGRIAQIEYLGVPWLCAHAAENAAAIAWGCYPMVPWAGRLRDGRYLFQGELHQVTPDLGPHAIHGLGYRRAWTVHATDAHELQLSLHLPEDAAWPFGGHVRQSLVVSGAQMRLKLACTAGERAMPFPALGWHPWFRKPERLDFAPSHHLPRDATGIALEPVPGEPPAPWDDCFINSQPVVLQRAGQILRLVSDCSYWVVFDERPHATCVEPQTAAPDAFNRASARVLPAGATVEAWFELQWRAV